MIWLVVCVVQAVAIGTLYVYGHNLCAFIAGQMRVEACKLLDWHSLPAVVREGE